MTEREKRIWALRVMARLPIPLNVIYECGWEMEGRWIRIDIQRELYVWQEALN